MAFHPSKLTDEGLGSSEAVLFSTAWTGNLPSAALSILGWRGTSLFFVQHLVPGAHGPIQIISAQW